MTAATSVAPPQDQAQSDEDWAAAFLGSATYQRPGSKPGRSAKTLERSTAERRAVAARGGQYQRPNAQLSAPGADALGLPRERFVYVSVAGNGDGWSGGYENAEVRLHLSAGDPGEWVPRQYVKFL